VIRSPSTAVLANQTAVLGIGRGVGRIGVLGVLGGIEGLEGPTIISIANYQWSLRGTYPICDHQACS